MKNFNELAEYIISLEKNVQHKDEIIKNASDTITCYVHDLKRKDVEIESLKSDLEYSSTIEYDLHNKVSNLTKCIDDLNAKIKKLEATYDPLREDLQKFIYYEWGKLHTRYWDVPLGSKESSSILGSMDAYDNILKRFYHDEY